MKRLLPAFVVALVVHGLILGLTFERLSQRRPEADPKRPVTMTFTYQQPSPTVEPKRPPQPQAQPPEKDPVAPPQQFKPQEPPVEKTPPAPRKPLLPPPPKPQPEVLEPKPVPELAVPPRPTRTDAPRSIKPVDAVAAPLGEVNDLSSPKDTVALPLRKARPLYRQNPPPRYPRSARRRGYEGSVILEVNVLRDGSVGDLRVLISSGYSVLDKAAVKSVNKWLFEPGLRGDQPVDMWVRVPIRFKIE